MSPSEHDLFFLPLGGTGEIGMNMNLYGHDDQWLMVDCGVTFPKPGRVSADGTRHHSGEPDTQMPDPEFIAARKDQLAGLIITHAHEDHIGAVPYLWHKLRCPVYCTRFTAEVLKKKLAEHGLLHQVKIIVPETGERVAIGPFEVEFLALTHSVPDPNALMIRTAAGNVFHTGDWKLDPEPVVGVPMYNFTIPAPMKSYLDFLCRAGITFKYTEAGAVGLLDNKPVHILATRGGLYKGTPADTQTPFLTTIFSFIGLSDVRFVYAEGLNLGDDSKNAALEAAGQEIAALA